MDLSPFVSSDPAVRADGWSPERKLRFLGRLAGRGNVRAACAAVGMSREAAYTLRRRDALFARGWAAALLLARERSVEVLADKAIDGIEEEVWYRGELRGTRRRFDTRLLLAHIARLDRMVEEAGAAAREDAGRFDEIVALVAGAPVPEGLDTADDGLPPVREAAVAEAELAAREAVEAAWADHEADKHAEGLPDQDHAAFCAALEGEVVRAGAEAGARWDGWFESACAAVDAALGRSQAEAEAADLSVRTPSDVSSSTAATAVGSDGRRYAYA